MRQPGEILSYDEMCREEGKRLQKGMNFQRGRKNAVFLMSRRKNALYTDVIEAEGRVLVYQGHDLRPAPGVDPKTADQPLSNPDGTLTDNGKFFEQAHGAKAGQTPRRVHVYEKLQTSIWTFTGAFDLLDAWVEPQGGRKVCKFRLALIDENTERPIGPLEHSRIIPGDVKAEVWKRDGGKCIQCQATENLHFDHILPYSKGGTSLRVENVQILCARHNLSKGAKIA